MSEVSDLSQELTDLEKIDSEKESETTVPEINHNVQNIEQVVLSTSKVEKTDGRKKPRTEKQVQALSKMRESRDEKMKQRKTYDNNEVVYQKQMSDLNTMLIYDMEKRRQTMKKDNKWTQMIDKKFDNLEHRLMEIMDGTKSTNSKTNKKRTLTDVEEEEEIESGENSNVTRKRETSKNETKKNSLYGITNPFANCKPSGSAQAPKYF
jgi:hypothetical protein